MWRALVFIGLLCLAAFAAVWLADHPGTLTITWEGREYLTSLAVGLVGVIVLAMVLAAVWAAIRFLLGAPGRIGRDSRLRRRNRGQAALSRGLIAIGSGDLTTARRYAGEAERLLDGEPLTLLLRAQTAQAAGDRPGAEAVFRRMLDHSETRVLGLRGLFLEARRRGDMQAARLSAEEATRLAPAVGWANEAMLESYSSEGDWAAAIRAVERRASLGLSSKTETRRQRAVLHAADAIARDKAGDTERALDAAQQALRLAPDLVPAAALAARILSRRGDLKRAAKIVETAWKTNQHPDLAAAYLNLRPGDSATDRLRRAETLARLSSWSPESRLAIGRAGIEAREFSRARETLRPIVEEQPTVRVCLMMAELEQAEGQTGRVREWLARAARAPRDKAWIADGIVSETWAPLSPVSGRLDAFVWDTPPDVVGRTISAEPGFLDDVMREPESSASLTPPRATLEDADTVPPAPPADAIAPAAPVPSPAPVTPAPVVPAQPVPVPAAPKPPAAVVAAPKVPEAAAPTLKPSTAAAPVAKPAPMPIPDEPLPLPEKAPEPAKGPATQATLPGGQSATPTSAPARPALNAASDPGRPAAKPVREPAPVVFPFAQAPDDPGPDGADETGSRFRVGA